MKLEHAIDRLNDANMKLDCAANEIKALLVSFVRRQFPGKDEFVFGVCQGGKLVNCFFYYESDGEGFIEIDGGPEVGMPVVNI